MHKRWISLKRIMSRSRARLRRLLERMLYRQQCPCSLVVGIEMKESNGALSFLLSQIANDYYPFPVPIVENRLPLQRSDFQVGKILRSPSNASQILLFLRLPPRSYPPPHSSLSQTPKPCCRELAHALLRSEQQIQHTCKLHQRNPILSGLSGHLLRGTYLRFQSSVSFGQMKTTSIAQTTTSSSTHTSTNSCTNFNNLPDQGPVALNGQMLCPDPIPNDAGVSEHNTSV